MGGFNCEAIKAELEIVKTEYDKALTFANLSILGFVTYLFTHPLTVKVVIIGLILLGLMVAYTGWVKYKIRKLLRLIRNCETENDKS